MEGVIQYSGIITKVHGLHRTLLKAEDYEALSHCREFSDAIRYLQGHPGYRDAFAGTVDTDLHRDVCERRLMTSLYLDYIGLYRFAGMDVRDFLRVFFRHYEILLIKQALRNVINLLSPDISLEGFDEFFHHHSQLSMEKMNHCDSISEFIAAIAGSEYEELLRPIWLSGSTRLADYEAALDFFYFSETWKVFTKKLSKADREHIIAGFGTDIDLLNLQWILRAKHYFHMEPSLIFRLLIPIRYKLKEDTLNQLVEAEHESELWSILSRTVYRNKLTPEDLTHLSQRADDIVSEIYRRQAQKHPYSLATIARYLYEKEAEIRTIIRFLEAIRYHLGTESIMAQLPYSIRKKGGPVSL